MQSKQHQYPTQKNKSLTLPKKQIGASLIGWMFIILALGTVATVGTKLVPLYVDHNTISNLMDKMAGEDGLADKRKSDLVKMMEGRMKLNNIRNFPLKENLEVERTKNGTDLKLNYEARVPFFQNIDFIATFSKEIELRK
ncbi:MAG: DUF4845 domain-containing protein [Pseudomonadales bacterium]|nr:DUF4845 domain-containing protein [Pseudomonadales bacterium]